MKRWIHLIMIGVTAALLLLPHTAQAADSTENDGNKLLEDELLDEVNLEGIQSYWRTIKDDYGGYIPGLDKTSLYEFIKENKTFSIKGVFSGSMEFLFHEFLENGKLLGTLLMLTLFSIILQAMHQAFERHAISRIAYFVVYIVLIFMALNSFHSVFTYIKDAVGMMSDFMIAMIPLLLGLLATFGNVIAVSFFNPIILFFVNTSGILVTHFILPLLFLGALLLIVSTLNTEYNVTYLADLFKTVALGALGIFLTVFLTIMAVQGVTSAIQDGVTMKTAKFVTGNFIPVVGRTFTDAADTILSASLLLKNAVGVVGVFIIIAVSLFPALQVLAIGVMYRLAAAILQPIGDGPVVTSLYVISKYIFYMLASLLMVTFMFFLSIVIIVAAGNLTLLLR